MIYPGVGDFELSQYVMRHIVLGQRVDNEVLIASRPLARPILIAFLLHVHTIYTPAIILNVYIIILLLNEIAAASKDQLSRQTWRIRKHQCLDVNCKTRAYLGGHWS